MKHNLYLYYGFPSTLKEKIALVKKHRFDGVFLFWDENFPAAAEMVRSAGLDIETVHLPFDRCNDLWVPGEVGEEYVAMMLKAIAEVAPAGVPTVIFHLSASDNPPPYNELGIARLARILRLCEENKINLALENLRRLDYLDYVYERLASDYLKFCFDSGHANAFTHNIANFPWENMPTSSFACICTITTDYATNTLCPLPGTSTGAALPRFETSGIRRSAHFRGGLFYRSARGGGRVSPVRESGTGGNRSIYQSVNAHLSAESRFFASIITCHSKKVSRQ